MHYIQYLQSFEQLKVLSDSRRYAILQHLMNGPATLTTLGKMLGEHPAYIRHHVKRLEEVGLVEPIEISKQSGGVEKFYRACACGFLILQLIAPKGQDRPVIIFSGSDDHAFNLLSSILSDQLDIINLRTGCIDGLIALRQNISNLAGVNLLDPSGEFNLPFIRHIFPDMNIKVITLAHREQGLMTASGNPKNIHSLADLVREDVTFVNGNPDSGKRLWVDQRTKSEEISAERIHGYKDIANTHTECANSIQTGKADVAIGLHAVAQQYNLGFIPLFVDRYDLVFAEEQASLLEPLLEMMRADSFRQRVTELAGYDVTHTGEVISL
jgi:putative molybdopterin biosynthesis protein